LKEKLALMREEKKKQIAENETITKEMELALKEKVKKKKEKKNCE
jgi:hypothetical protein